MKIFIINELQSIFRYFWEKILLTIPVGYFIFKESHFVVVYALLMILVLDTFLGMWVAHKYKIFNSHRLSRTATKIGRYGVGLASIWILSCLEPDLFGWSFQFFGVFFVLTEVFSNFEKLSLLGLKLPTQLLAKLNKNFNDFYFGEEKTKQKAVHRILNKEGDCGLSIDEITTIKKVLKK